MAAPETRIGVADSDDLQQQTVRHPAASGIDVQEANASPVINDAPTNAARAIAEIRSLVKAIGMVPSRNILRRAFDTLAQFIVGAQGFEDKLNVVCFTLERVGLARLPIYLYSSRRLISRSRFFSGKAKR